MRTICANTPTSISEAPARRSSRYWSTCRAARSTQIPPATGGVSLLAPNLAVATFVYSAPLAIVATKSRNRFRTAGSWIL